MSKGLMQDMVRVGTPLKLKEKSKILEFKGGVSLPKEKGVRKSNTKYRIFLLAIISIVALLFALSYLFTKAKITIIPKTISLDINDDISASKNSSQDSLAFDLVVLSGEETKKIIGGEMKEVSNKATGTVVIYNSYNSSSQALDIDTRLEGSNGKIYKTAKKVVVPGIKEGKPGSVEVDIYASQGGESYNSGPIDYKIVGFNGTPKYTKFYARSKGDISGGFIGKIGIVSDLEKISAENELRAILESRLLAQIKEQIPDGFILFNDAIVLDIKDTNTTFLGNDDSTITAKVKGTLYGFLFEKDELVKKLAEDSIEEYDGSPLYLENLAELSFNLKNREDIVVENIKTINFTLLGSLNFVFKVDTEKLAQEVMGKPKKEFNKILELYKNIDSTNLVLRPFWKRSFPEELEDIEIIVNYPFQTK